MTIDDSMDWARQQWGGANLGDKRRTRRAVRLGAALAAQPDASLPAQTGRWSELKAAYRLLSEPDVTHEALTQPHRLRVIGQARNAPRVVLFLQDTTELDYSSHKQTQGLGHIGDAKGRGILVHSCLAVLPPDEKASLATCELLGLASQSVWTRDDIKTGTETRAERAKRRTEADIWAETLEQIGAPPPPSDSGGDAHCAGDATLWVSVGDRGSDIFTYVKRARSLGWHCLLRVYQDRVIKKHGSGERERLLNCLRSLPVMGSKEITLRGRDGNPSHTVTLRVAWQPASVCAPALKTLSSQPGDEVEGWYIRCWEDSKNKDALEWLVFTTVPIRDAHCAEQVLSWYSYRWLLEEYHKCLKTGCSLEQRQLRSGAGLRALLGFISLVGLRLLQLRSVSRECSERLASSEVPLSWLELLSARQGSPPMNANAMTLGKFWHSVAGLGGFIGRKSDGEPGWQTLWRGWFRLQDMLWAASWADATRAESKCG